MLTLKMVMMAMAVAAQAAPAPDHAAHVDRFLAALPPDDAEPDRGATAADTEEVARRVVADPDKAAAIRAAIAARVACNDKAAREYPMRVMRGTADQMTDAELDKLTEFYAGPDYAKLLAAGDAADTTPYLARYPLQHFNDLMQKAFANAPDEVLAAADACQAVAQASLTAAGVKN